MNIPLIINVLVFVALLILLAKLGSNGWSLSKKVLLGLVFGVAYGVGLHLVYGSGHQTVKD
ncbi:L-cystine transporter, partial [Klebsiella quasipneumoniae]|nr:L-cystine transporter [Klebsiella quasipneumoniae]